MRGTGNVDLDDLMHFALLLFRSRYFERTRALPRRDQDFKRRRINNMR